VTFPRRCMAGTSDPSEGDIVRRRHLALSATAALVAGTLLTASAAPADVAVPGRMIALLYAPSLDGSSPNVKAINDANVIVGQSNSRATKWVDGLPQQLTALPGYEATAATGINAAGVIVGWAGPKTGLEGRRPVRWNPDGSYTVLTGTNESSWAEAISDDGHIVGRMGVSLSSARPVRIRNGRNDPIVTEPGFVTGVAVGGVVSGHYPDRRCRDCTMTAFVDGSLVRGSIGLHELPGGTDGTTTAGAITSDGRKIAGVADNHVVTWTYNANPSDGVYWRLSQLGRPAVEGVLTVAAMSANGGRIAGHARTAVGYMTSWVYENGAFTILPAHATDVEGVNVHGVVTGHMALSPVIWR
jgi:uncharacterized membrane protein